MFSGKRGYDTSLTNSLYPLTSPLASGTYYWWVQAIGSGSVSGAWSSERNFVH